VCVDGIEIVGDGGLGFYAENGITITGTLIDTVKLESCPLKIERVLAVFLAIAGGIVFRKSLFPLY
jgi:hypothetical protein